MKQQTKFKETEIGMIPEDWKLDVLGKHLYIKGRIGWKGLQKSEYLKDNKGISIINGTQIQDSKLDWTDCGRVPEWRYDESPEIQLKEKDIVMTKDGTIGKVAIINKLPEKSSVASGIFVIRGESGKIDQQFLFYYFKSPLFKFLIETRKEGSVIPHLYQRDFEEFPFAYPLIKEQQAIAKILSDLDSKIELNQEINKTLEIIGQAIFKHWFVDFEFSNKDDKPYKFSGGEMINSELGIIPKGWKIKPLDEVANFLNGLALQKYPPEKDFEYLPVIKIRELRQGVTKSSDKASVKIDEEYIVKDGDILFSWSGSLTVIIWCGGLGALNQHLFKVTSKLYSKWFYYYWVKYFLPNFQHIAEGKATTMGHIQRKHLSDSLVLVPPEQILNKMNFIMSSLLDQIIINSIELQKLSQIRDSILPKLMSGKIRVPVEVS